MVVFANEHKDEVYLTRPPILVQKALFAILGLLAPVGRLLGYRATYPQSSAEEPTGNGSSSAAPRPRGIVVAATIVAIFLVLFLLRRRNRQGRG